MEISDETYNRIMQWADAYPEDIFAKPDYQSANAALKQHGMSVDAISADSMRYVITKVAKMLRDDNATGEANNEIL